MLLQIPNGSLVLICLNFAVNLHELVENDLEALIVALLEALLEYRYLIQILHIHNTFHYCLLVAQGQLVRFFEHEPDLVAVCQINRMGQSSKEKLLSLRLLQEHDRVLPLR